MIVHHSQPHGRAESTASRQLGAISLISPHLPLRPPPHRPAPRSQVGEVGRTGRSRSLATPRGPLGSRVARGQGLRRRPARPRPRARPPAPSHPHRRRQSPSRARRASSRPNLTAIRPLPCPPAPGASARTRKLRSQNFDLNAPPASAVGEAHGGGRGGRRARAQRCARSPTRGPRAAHVLSSRLGAAGRTRSVYAASRRARGCGVGDGGTFGRRVGREWFSFSGEPTSRPTTRVGQLAEPNARRWMSVRGRETSISGEIFEFLRVLGQILILRLWDLKIPFLRSKSRLGSICLVLSEFFLDSHTILDA